MLWYCMLPCIAVFLYVCSALGDALALAEASNKALQQQVETAGGAGRQAGTGEGAQGRGDEGGKNMHKMVSGDE